MVRWAVRHEMALILGGIGLLVVSVTWSLLIAILK